MSQKSAGLFKHSLCEVFDYPPVTYFAPAVYGFVTILSVPYFSLHWIKGYLLQKMGALTNLEIKIYNWCTSFEFFGIVQFSTIFAINTESIRLHSASFIVTIIGLAIGTARNMW